MPLHPTVVKLQERLRERGLDVDVRELTDSTKTAAQAAAAVGADDVGQIVKSLVFTDSASSPFLVLCAGDRRVDSDRLGVGDGVAFAPPDVVREATGFAIGGVPPLGHDHALPTIVDESLRRFDVVWCAAGTPNAVFSVATEELISAIGDADVRDVG